MAHSTLRSGLGYVFGCAISALLLFGSAKAHAYDDDYESEARRHRGRLMLALDGDFSSALKSPVIQEGGGGQFRIGTQRRFFLVTLIPELAIDHHRFGARDANDASITTGRLGGRIRFLRIVEPGIFAHVGIGHVGGDELYRHTGVAFDAGVTVDLTILPLIDLGLHAAWNRVFGGYDSGVAYATAGAHVALVL